MTLDEAIKHAEEVADTKLQDAELSEIQVCYNNAKKCSACAEEHRQLEEWLKELKKLRAQTQWIPVSERPPEIHQDVFLSLRSLDVVVGFRAETEPYFCCQGDYVAPQNVLAWIPKPEPYKTESENKE